MQRFGLFVMCAVVLALALPLAADDGIVLKFDGGIGVIPGPNGVANANVVQGTLPPGQPWVIARLTANIKADGRISVDGRGLLLAGGNGIGTNGNQSVRPVLFCGGAPSTTESAVPLEPNGDFTIDDVLSPEPPSPCNSPTLLIVNDPGGRWFAAGILKRSVERERPALTARQR